MMEGVPLSGRAKGEGVARVGVHGLNESKEHPDSQGDKMGVEDEGPGKEGEEGEAVLDGVGILDGDGLNITKFMMEKVDLLKEGRGVKEAVAPIEDGVVDDEEGDDLPGDDPERIGRALKAKA